MIEWNIPAQIILVNRLAASFELGIFDDNGNLQVNDHQVARVNGLKIEIFSGEHSPPHFRVIYQGESNNFTIKDCTPQNGNGLRKFFNNIKKWHLENKDSLIKTWNETRPTDCPVGPYTEDSQGV